MSTINERMLRARKELGKTQNSIAKMAKINLRTYIHYEKGEREPSLAVMNVYSSFGINLNWLLTGEGNMFQRPVDPSKLPPIPDDAAELFNMILKMTPEEREEAKIIMQRERDIGQMKEDMRVIRKALGKSYNKLLGQVKPPQKPNADAEPVGG